MPQTVEPVRPPVPKTAAGDTRRVGVEIEFAGLDVGQAARLTHDVFGGEVSETSPHRIAVENTAFGDFMVELDAQVVHKGESDADADASEKILPDEIDTAAREAFGKAVTGIVPVEIVTPPMPWDKLGRVGELVVSLRQAGAKGTDDGLLYAFGLHLNPELPDTEPATVSRHLRAYFVLVEWLRDQIDVDVTRRVMPHSDPFPKDYVLKVLDPDYDPDRNRLISDYLDANPTRNRDLDMLPLFRHMDEAAVTARLNDPLIKARPTFHYRLPDCALGDPDWSPVLEWNRWVKVEELAADEERLAALAASCREALKKPAPEQWLDDVRAWLDR